MYDIQKIGKIISDIEKKINELESYSVSKIEDLKDGKTFNASSMVLFAILTKVIDLGNELISVEKVGAPNSYQDIMPLLAKANIINKDQAESLNNLIKKRNVLAHFYDDIKEKDLIFLIKEISLIKSFLQTVKKRVGKEK
jgi:uncharacterized protein YutE (UPF0331/DUF86 family)